MIKCMEVISTIIIVKHDVESKAESNNEEGIPKEKKEEWIEDSVEHGHIDIAGEEFGMSTNEGDELGPGEHDCNGP